MKTPLAVILLLVSTTLGFAQGKLSFSNDSTRLVYFSTNASLLNPADAAMANNALTAALIGSLSGSPTLRVTLWGGTSASSLTLQTSAAAWSAAAGRWTAINTTLPTLPPGVTNYFQIQIYDSRATNAVDAWAHPGWYAGATKVFTFAPQASAYTPIYDMNAPEWGTWAPGTVTGLANSTGLGDIEVRVGATPPGIVLQPSDQVAYVGGAAAFQVGAVGLAPFSYQWSWHGTNVWGATQVPFVLTNLQLLDAGVVTVVVTNSLGAVTSEPAYLQVLPPNAPSIRINNRLAVGTVTSVASAQLTIAAGFTNGFIFYTLDGSTPTTSSPLYTGPITLTNSVTIQAMSLSADFMQTAYAPPVMLQIIPVYSLQASVIGSGTITLNPATGPYPSNSVVVLTANPAIGWGFDHWTGDVTGSQNPANLTMSGPRSVQAVFVQTHYPLTATTPGGGSVSVNGQVLTEPTFYPIGAQ